MTDNRLKAAMLSMLICLLLWAAACQPTPEVEAVVNKGGGQLEEKVLEQPDESAGAEAAPAEDHIIWSETKTVNIQDMGDYTVTVNLDAQAPELPGKVPVYLVEPREFSIEFMKKAAEYLMKGEIFDGKASKEDVTRELLDYKKAVNEHTILDGLEQEIESYYAFMDKRYNDAADGNSEAKFEYSDDEYGERSLSLKSYPADDNSIMRFSTFIGTDGFIFSINEFNRSFRYMGNFSGGNIQAKGTKLTYEQALMEADKAMEALFEEPFAMMYTDITDKINHQEYLWNDGEETSKGQAYVFYYNREYGGMPSLFIQNAPIVLTEQTEYAEDYGREGVCVVVDDRGIAQMWCESHSGVAGTLNENVSLLPFDEVLERFKDGVFYHNLWGFGGSTVEITITRIEFGMVREPLKDNPDQFMMAPAWNFVGNIGNSAKADKYEDFQEKSILALSAIDGGIITDFLPMLEPK